MNFGANDTEITDANDNATETATRYEDTHPNTPSIFGYGPGFMDDFNAAPYAEKRGGNLYHPFSSREEWSLASWLLCSGLSMRVIDDFLALPIVSLEIHSISFSLTKKEGPATFPLFRNRENATHPHGPCP